MKNTIDRAIETLYHEDRDRLLSEKRLTALHNVFSQQFGREPGYFISVPGRTELGGNHTDHNHGKVLAAAVNLDTIAWANQVPGDKVTLISEGFPEPFEMNLAQLTVVEGEKGTTTALIRGIAARLADLNYGIGGFEACMTSDISIGSGLSSSASVEVLIGTTFNALFNDGSIALKELAGICQYAEIHYFGKPCGLMDQMACSVGGLIGIDFKSNADPEITRVHLDLDSEGYRLLIVETGGSHAGLTAEYAAIRSEMQAVAYALGEDNLRELSSDDVLENLAKLRSEVGDRAILRAEHFFKENERVDRQIEALRHNDFQSFLRIINESGDSSYRWLQNIYTTRDPRHQSVALALLLSEQFIERNGTGAVRVHGGGFAGTIQLFLPVELCDEYRRWMHEFIGPESIKVLQTRAIGSWYCQ